MKDIIKYLEEKIEECEVAGRNCDSESDEYYYSGKIDGLYEAIEYIKGV